MENVFKKAHEITKNIIRKGDSYRETFRLALIFVYSQIKKGVDKMLDKKEIIELGMDRVYSGKNIDTNKTFKTEFGTIKYINGDTPVKTGWFMIFDKPNGDIVGEGMMTFTQKLKGGNPAYPKNLYSENYNKKLEEKRKKSREKFLNNKGKCWECGCKLDRNGNCPVCGYSKEIYEF